MKSAVFFIGAVAALSLGCATQVKRIRVDPEPKAPIVGAFSWPVAKARVISRFGPRGRGYHTGIDMKKSRRGGDPVLASKSGWVIFAGRMRGYGKLVTVKHKDGYKTRYAHLKKILVKKGDWVDARQKIGVVGGTGRVTTPHLHFEVITPTGYFTNPARFLR